MNSIFRSYPSHPWLSQWTLEPRDYGTAGREIGTGHFFRTHETVGRVLCANPDAEWSLQIPIPQNSRINLLFNGFCGYFSRSKRRCLAEVLVPEPGVLWGRFRDIPPPVLAASEPIIKSEEFQWIEDSATPVLLAIRKESFCLVTKFRTFTDAVQHAETVLDMDIENAVSEELRHRAGTEILFEHMHHHDSLAAIGVESMMRALRPPEGKIDGIWSQSPTAGKPEFNINELSSLVSAWRHINIEVAENLVRTALKLQASSGAIPVNASPHTTHSILEAPKPMLAKTAETAWEVRQDPAFLAEILPSLRRHLQWSLHHFDPKRRGQYCWQNSNEPIVPKLYMAEQASADLAALLLTEIDALNRLREHHPDYADEAAWFSKEHDLLKLNLDSQFWNEQAGSFSNAFIRGQRITAEGFPAFLPLLWRDLPSRKKNTILSRIKETGTLPGGLNVLSWGLSTSENQVATTLQQQLILDTLRTADPKGGTLHDFARITLQGFLEWHTLSIEQNRSLHFDPVTAAFVINTQYTHNYRYYAQGRFTSRVVKVLRKMRIDWIDISIVLFTFFLVFSVRMLYITLHQAPNFDLLTAQMNSAYAYRNDEATLQASLQIIEYYPEYSAVAKLRAGNISLMRGDYAAAAGFLADVRNEFPDSPGPMIAHGLACQLIGQFDAAESNYYEFVYIFGEIFPEIAETIQTYRNLAQEGFRSPPKWPEIYRYQIMHEL
jgi:hypothetical protein